MSSKTILALQLAAVAMTLAACGSTDNSQGTSSSALADKAAGGVSALNANNGKKLTAGANGNGATSTTTEATTTTTTSTTSGLLTVSTQSVTSTPTTTTSGTSGISYPPVNYVPSGCATKSIALDPTRTDGFRASFAFPELLEANPGVQMVSPCVKLTGVGGPLSIQMQRGSPISINGGPFISTPQTVNEGDQIQVKYTTSSDPDGIFDESVLFGGTQYLGVLDTRTVNQDRAPTVFSVGATRTYKQLNDVAPLLRAGDVVEVDPGTYSPAEFTRSGTASAPIIIRGVGNQRPVISGGTWTVSFKNSHSMVFENFEVTGGNTICLRTMAHNVTVRNVFIHDCARMGVLGADLGNGVNVFDRVEIARSGGVYPNEALSHGLYVATDRDRFPNAVLRVQNSYLHDNRGNSIKSRSTRNEIYSNWIDVPNDSQSFYSIELIGYQEYAVDTGLNSDVVGNVMVHRNNYGMRFGGDGVGDSKGRVRMANNTLFLSSNFGAYDSLIRLTGSLDSLYLLNNAFVRGTGDTTPTRLFYNAITAWVSGSPKVSGTNNIFPVGTYGDKVTPLDSMSMFAASQMTNTVLNNQNLATLNVNPGSDPALSQAAPMTTMRAGYEFDNLSTIIVNAMPTAPVEGSALSVGSLKTATTIGVF